jgi:hypothetical protein
MEYLIELKKSGASYSRFNVNISALQAYYDVYDIEANFDKVRKNIPEQVRKVKRIGHIQNEKSESLLEVANTRVRVLILLFLSTGIRVRAVSTVVIDITKHVSPLNYLRFIDKEM